MVRMKTTKEYKTSELPKDDTQLRAWCINQCDKDVFMFIPRDEYLKWLLEAADKLYKWCKDGTS